MNISCILMSICCMLYEKKERVLKNENEINIYSIEKERVGHCHN